MQYTTSSALCAALRVLPARLHILAVLCFVALALVGQPLEVSAGWSVWPPAVYATQATVRRRRAVTGSAGAALWAARSWASRTWAVPLCRSLLLQVVWWTSSHSGPAVGALLPWLAWGWQLSGLLRPFLTRQPEWWLLQRLLSSLMQNPFWLLMALALSQAAQALPPPSVDGHLLLVGGLVSPAMVSVQHDTDGKRYTAEFNGCFTLTMADDDPFRLRLFILALRSLDVDEKRRGRRTRDGRTPAVRQQELATALGIPQPDISRWERYWFERNWADLLSLHSPEVLTRELVQTIIGTWVHWPLWTADQVWHLLTSQGVLVTLSQVQQAAQESGWSIVRQVLGRLCTQRAEGLQLTRRVVGGGIVSPEPDLAGQAGERTRSHA